MIDYEDIEYTTVIDSLGQEYPLTDCTILCPRVGEGDYGDPVALILPDGETLVNLSVNTDDVTLVIDVPENTVYALAIANLPNENTVWAFGYAEEFEKALTLLKAHRVPHFAYHRVNSKGHPENITAWRLSDEKWEELSQGLNDAGEIENWIEENHDA